MYNIHISHNIVTFSIDSNPVVNHIWTCSCVFCTDAFKRSTVGSGIPVVFHCHGMVEPNHSHGGPTALMLQYQTCHKHSNTPCSGQNVLPKALQVFTIPVFTSVLHTLQWSKRTLRASTSLLHPFRMSSKSLLHALRYS